MQPPFTAETLCAASNQRLAELGLTPVDARTNPQVTARNLRYYQTLGLLPPVGRNAGRAVYGSEHLEAVVAVKQAQAKGTSLREIPRWTPPATLPDPTRNVPPRVRANTVLGFDELWLSELRTASVVHSVVQSPLNAAFALRTGSAVGVPQAGQAVEIVIQVGWNVDLGYGTRLSGTGDAPAERVLLLIKNLINETGD
jgi:hypothetical protein